jgi:hypothetical protein
MNRRRRVPIPEPTTDSEETTMNTAVLRSRSRNIQIAGALVSLLMVSILTWRASTAAFTDTTDNTGNYFSAAGLSLTDDDGSTALFNSPNMSPTDSVTDCIVVTYAGDLAVTPVRLYGSIVDDSSFGGELDMTVDIGTGGTFGNCAGFTLGSNLYTGTMTGFTTTHTNFASGLDTWTPTAGNLSRTFRFTVTLGSDTPNGFQGDDVTAAFTWEIQSI